jgi:tetracycline 7-halogenase / FADH2 O2-dependent halogenase
VSVIAEYDIVVVGSGFAGSLIAMIARRAGRSVLLLEKGRHPRFAIGESSTPLSNLLLEELAARYDLPRLKPLTKWGTWQQSYPELSCGLKRGFSFYHHAPDADIFDRERQLLVAASPCDAISDTHWYRADFDEFFVREAQERGVDYLDQVALSQMHESPEGVAVEGERFGEAVQFRCRFLIDATGPRGFVHRALGLREAVFPEYPHTQALYTHFSGVARFADAVEEPPYAVDDAALHHVFDGGWIWVLRFNNGLTSAGVAGQLRLEEGKAAWERLLDCLPSVKEQFAGARAELPFVHAKRLSFLSESVAGRRWAMLPSAAAFVDPLLSTGFPLTLLGVARLAEIIAEEWESPRFARRIESYAAQTRDEAVAAARLIGALYATMHNFPLFTSISMLYFAAASFAETARRLGKHHLASSFLLCKDPVFGPACVRFCEQAMRVRNEPESSQLRLAIRAAIEPFDVAGLCETQRRNWFPVDPNDLLRAAAKLGATQDEVKHLIESLGFAG